MIRFACNSLALHGFLSPAGVAALALWGAACAFVATLLHNFASYAAALAGYTAAIIAADELGATGGPNADAVFLLAVYRARSASEL